MTFPYSTSQLRALWTGWANDSLDRATKFEEDGDIIRAAFALGQAAAEFWTASRFDDDPAAHIAGDLAQQRALEARVDDLAADQDRALRARGPVR